MGSGQLVLKTSATDASIWHELGREYSLKIMLTRTIRTWLMASGRLPQVHMVGAALQILMNQINSCYWTS